MSDIALDQGGYFPSPLTEWYRERPFKVALVGSLLVHAVLIAAVPGFRSVTIDIPQVLNVEILKEELPQPVAPVPIRRQQEPRHEEPAREIVQPPPAVEPLPPQPVVEQPDIRPEPKRVEPQRQPEPTVRQPDPVIRQPEPVVRQPVPDAPQMPKTEIIEAVPRPSHKQEFVVPKPEPRPAPTVEPRAEVRPESPAPRVAPAQPSPTVQPQIEQVTPPERVAPPTPVAPLAAVQPPPVVAPAAPPQPAAKAEPAVDRTVVSSYEKSLSDLIKRHEKYPDRAKRQGWQGTAVVALSLSAEGKVTGISVVESSGKEILDQAALEMVRRASPLPRAPEGLRGQERIVRVPIVFKLQDS
ncbi:MAG TPA: TonB family protein [Burkholderiales bacterium]